MHILVTGGAGYIGSHVIKQLINEDIKITIIDNLSSGLLKSIETLKALSNNIDFINEDLSNWTKIDAIFKNNKFDAIMHFAASLVVPESVKNPIKYYLNNTANTVNLIAICNKYNINKFIFSSTAAVYGEPSSENIPVKESTQTNPINPYGYSKLFIEQILNDNAKANQGFKFISLRYFNVAGASIDGSIGQSTKDATHLIKIAAQVALNQKEKMYIFGDDYDTKDGTCIRDYIHIEDLSSAHVLALFYLENNDSDIFNVGYGKGYSVNEVIQTMQKVSQNNFKVEIKDKREGDPAILISNNEKIKALLKWQPAYDSLDTICKTAILWENKLKNENEK